MKSIYNNTYPAYSYTYKGVEFIVFKVMTGNYGNVARWYMHFNDIYFISERDSAQEFSSKKSCLGMAKFYIDKKTGYENIN